MRVSLDTNVIIRIFIHSINLSSNLNWSFKRQATKFVKRFFKEPYRNADTIWIKRLASDNHVFFISFYLVQFCTSEKVYKGIMS